MLVEPEDRPEKPETPSPAHHSPIRVRSDLQEEYSADEIGKMTALYEGTLSNIEEGEIVKSKVLRVTDTAVILDVGFKSEGAVPIDEFKDAHALKEGDEIEVFLEHLERSEEHTSELQSQSNLVCRLLLEKKKKTRRLDRCHRHIDHRSGAGA